MPQAYDFDTVIDRHGTGSTKWDRYPADVLPMWIADSDFALAPEIMAALQERLRHPVLGYAVAQDSLRAQMVAHLEATYGWSIRPEDLIFLPGVAPGFNMALRAMLSPGDGVLVQPPMYGPIMEAPGHWGLRRVEVPLRPAPDGSIPLDGEAFRAGARQSRALLFCNPHNPLGKVFTRPELESIAETCLAEDLLIISDEIHCDLVFDGRPHIPMATLSPEVARRTITLMSSSKTYNTAGLKAAFAIIQDPALRQKVNAARQGMVDSVNALGLEATRAAYASAGAWRDQQLAYLQANRDWLVAAVAQRLPGITMHRPEGTFLAWLDCRGLGLNEDPQAFFLREARVGLSAGTDFGSEGRDGVRLNFACPRPQLEAAVDRMAAALASRRR
jgi:cystathionine beta-lyase